MDYRDWERGFDDRMKAQRKSFDRAWRWMPWIMVILVIIGITSMFWMPMLFRMGWEAGKR